MRALLPKGHDRAFVQSQPHTLSRSVPPPSFPNPHRPFRSYFSLCQGLHDLIQESPSPGLFLIEAARLCVCVSARCLPTQPKRAICAKTMARYYSAAQGENSTSDSYFQTAKYVPMLGNHFSMFAAKQLPQRPRFDNMTWAYVVPFRRFVSDSFVQVQIPVRGSAFLLLFFFGLWECDDFDGYR